MNKSLCSSVCVGVVYLILVGHANAALIYDESVSGDTQSYGFTNLTLLTGSNTIIGSTFVRRNRFYREEDDGYNISLLPNHVIDSATITINNIVVTGSTNFVDLYLGPQISGGVGTTSTFYLYNERILDNFTPIPDGTVFDLIGNGSITANGVNTAGAVRNSFSVIPTTTTPNNFAPLGSYNVSFNYQIDFVTRDTTQNFSIPEPSIIALMGLGLTSLIGFGRYRKRLTV